MYVGTIALVHGIGKQKPGYSQEWQESIQHYLGPHTGNFHEIYWQDVLKCIRIKDLAQNQVNISKTMLSILSENSGNEKGNLEGWIKDTVFDFVQYLTNKKMNARIKERLKNPLLLFKKSTKSISIISHSWGTVISFDVLCDLRKEGYDFTLANLFTLGSPLWLLKKVDTILSRSQYGNAKKPDNIKRWVNIYVENDPIGSSLDSFDVDKDFRVQSIPGMQPHLSYLVKKNRIVLDEIIVHFLSRGGKTENP